MRAHQSSRNRPAAEWVVVVSTDNDRKSGCLEAAKVQAWGLDTVTTVERVGEQVSDHDRRSPVTQRG
jgi:hypothetical protein